MAIGATANQVKANHLVRVASLNQANSAGIRGKEVQVLFREREGRGVEEVNGKNDLLDT